MRRVFRLGVALALLIAISSVSADEVDTADLEAVWENCVKVYQEGRYQEARQLASFLHLACDERLGSDAVLTKKAYFALGRCYRALGQGQLALPILETLLSREPSNPSYLEEFARSLMLIGRLDEALDVAGRAVRVHEEVGRQVPAAWAKLTLADILVEAGDYEQAESLYRNGVDELSEEWEALRARPLVGLARLSLKIGDLEQAEKALQEAHELQNLSLSNAHSESVKTEMLLANVKGALGDSELAAQLQESALPSLKKGLGDDHPLVALAHLEIGTYYLSREQIEDARAHFQSARQIGTDQDGKLTSEGLSATRLLGMLEIQAGRLNKSRLHLRTFLKESPNHPERVSVLEQLGFLQIEAGRVDLALERAKEAEAARLELTKNVFGFASERQRLAYRQSLRPFRLFATLGSGNDLLQATLRYKGLVLDSVVEDLQLAESGDDLESKQKVLRLRAVRNQLNQLDRSPKDSERRQALEAEFEQLQRSLTRSVGSSRRAFRVVPSDVQAALPDDSALIEFLRYEHLVGQAKYEARYGAVILSSTGELAWVEIGSAEQIEGLVHQYQFLMRGKRGSGRFALAQSTSQTPEAKEVLNALYASLWSPLEAQLPPKTRTVIVSPDGQLNFLSFATLLTPEDVFLAEQYQIAYVSSGRDLLSSRTEARNEESLLVGDPTFDLNSDGRLAAEPHITPFRGILATEWMDIHFARLPHTGEECRNLESLLGHDSPVASWTRLEASEARLRAVENPRLLHLATHGFFLPEPESQVPAVDSNSLAMQASLKDPMQRSGLALAGAESTARARSKGDRIEPTRDGILTAAEVGTLKLEGTWLVTLSACDTGSGEAKAGEGVLGLRRGFVLAGAQNLLLTLWPVADKETAQLMLDFYKEAETRSPPAALHTVQRHWLEKLRSQGRPLDEVVRLAGPFVLSCQGKLSFDEERGP